MSNWDNFYLGLAKYVSTKSKDPSTKVGAVIADPQHRVVSIGFNGLPRGVVDSIERLADRELKYKMVTHAEVNALTFARGSVVGCTLYTWPFMPCVRCAGQIIQSGIAHVKAPQTSIPRWADEFLLAQTMFEEASVTLTLFDS